MKQYTHKAGSSVRNSQNDGKYFRKVVRSPRPINLAKPINKNSYIHNGDKANSSRSRTESKTGPRADYKGKFSGFNVVEYSASIYY